MTRWSFILVAAGKGSRFGEKPKQLEFLGEWPLWEWAARMACSLEKFGLAEVVVVAPFELMDRFDLMRFPPGVGLRLAPGGKTRRDSVLLGLRAATSEWSLIHDAARPFASAALCLRLMEEAVIHGAAVPLLPVPDALKVMEDGSIVATCERSKLRLTQTPQAFPTKTLEEILVAGDRKVADEAEAWITAGKSVAWVCGEVMNYKITYPDDMRMARLAVSGAGETRTGLGYDIHPLYPGRILVLGGVRIPFPLGLAGHSDGDLLCHSISDAILGAAGLPDIGTLFPSSDPEYKNAFSLGLLEDVVRRIHSNGFRVRSVDAVINAQIPRLAPWIEEMERSLRAVLFGEAEGTLTIKAKSGEKSGPVGNGEAIACWSVATIKSLFPLAANLKDPEKNQLSNLV
ncbi:MAG: 2-C-methyl-D-erythritol 2,4-cyclodiphosphate synthase [Thermovirgaceae bacterium]|nr:2-C-methyl-D-erythritol 2,4-cyclodiphosphate synthase [Thermovirgaceae bacterium]